MVDAEAAGGRGDGLRERPHPALHVAPDAAGAVALAHHVVEEHVGRAGSRGRGHGADDGVGGERGLHLVRLEPAVEDGSRRRGQDLHGSRAVAAELEEAPPGAGEAEEVAGASGEGVGGRLEKRGLDGPGDPLQHGLVGGEPFGVARGELRHLAPVQRRVGPHEQRAAVGEGSEGRRVARQELVAVAGELEVADDLRAEEAHHVGGRGDPEPRPGLLGDRRAAHPVAGLEHEDLLAGARQVGGGDEPVVAGADDDRVPGLHASSFPRGAAEHRRSLEVEADARGRALTAPGRSCPGPIGRVSTPTRVGRF